jgi:hypothetical protein
MAILLYGIAARLSELPEAPFLKDRPGKARPLSSDRNRQWWKGPETPMLSAPDREHL